MKNIVVYYSNVEPLLKKAGYTLGYETLSDCSDPACKVSCWFKGISVISVFYSGGIIIKVKDCNDKIVVSASDTTYQKFLKNIKKMFRATPAFPPTLLSVLSGVVIPEGNHEHADTDKIFAATSHMSADMLLLFKEDLRLLSEVNNGVVIEPKRFDFYSSKENGKIYFISEVCETNVILSALCDAKSKYMIISGSDLVKYFNHVDEPTDLAPLVMSSVNAFHEITNLTELIDMLTRLGCTNLDDLNYMSQPVQFGKISTIQVPDVAMVNDICFRRDYWCLYVNVGYSLGSCNLSYTVEYPPTVKPVNSLTELIAPTQFVEFATNYISSLLTEASVVLNDMPDIREYLIRLLQALSSIKVPAIPHDMTWQEVKNRYVAPFDPFAYLRDTYDIDVSKLPVASVADCKTPADCVKLYTQVKDLIS